MVLKIAKVFDIHILREMRQGLDTVVPNTVLFAGLILQGLE